MRINKYISFLILGFVLLAGCQNDYDVIPESIYEATVCENFIEDIPTEPTDPADWPEVTIIDLLINIPEKYPDIEVSPLETQFGSLDVLDLESYESTFKIFNIGEKTLYIERIELKHDVGQYEITSFSLDPIAVSNFSEFEVIFHPDSAGTQEDFVLITSNDPDEPIVEVRLEGDGLAPKIELTPWAYGFGSSTVGCEESVDVLVENIGTTNLIVSDLTFSTTTDLKLVIDYDLYGDLPWTLYPGDVVPVEVVYEAYDEDYDISFLSVDSNDPQLPVAVATQEGDAKRSGDITEEYIQEETSRTDILFVIDNSCSMGEEQLNLSSNASLFISALQASGADFHIGVITTDDANFIGPMLTPVTPGLITEFEYQLVAGISGSPTEQGLLMADKATSPGGDAAPGSVFFRDDAKLTIVIISDEDDFSPLRPVDYTTRFQALKANPDRVVLHVVAGLVPVSTCFGPYSAVDYNEAAMLMGGMHLDICTTDWGVDLELLAAAATALNTTFELDKAPLEETIEVQVDGNAQLVGWHYDEYSNAVIFDSTYAPLSGQLVEISYGYYGACP